MLRSFTCSVVILSALTLASSAQQATREAPQNAPTFGSIIGHVYCSDTNAPARLAKVTLMPIPEDTGPSTPAEKETHQSSHSLFTPIQTLLDGSFTMPHVEPGYYYLVVQYPGYVSPVSQLTREDLAHPSLEMQKFIASVLPSVSVASNRVTTSDIRIQRGAAIKGIIHYDDGSPAPDLYISVLRKDKKGHWKPIPNLGGTSDDEGHYRIIGLPAGEYILQADLSLQDDLTDHLFNSSESSGGSYSTRPRYDLPIFSGGATRQTDAKRIKLGDGEDDSGEDIVIPISKLHSITGNITQARNGHVINAGTVVLQYPDDNSEAATAKVDKTDSTFHFDFVPEGNYILKVTDARDVTREEISNGPAGTMPPTHTKETTIKNYGEQQQPIVIVGDMSNILVPVPEKAAQKATP
jgi:hypothetical protein